MSVQIQQESTLSSDTEFVVLLDINPIITAELCKLTTHGHPFDHDVLYYFASTLVDNYQPYYDTEDIVQSALTDVLHEINSEVALILPEYYRDIVTRIRNIVSHPVDLVAVIEVTNHFLKVVLTHAD